jgi:hypothetical protein
MKSLILASILSLLVGGQVYCQEQQALDSLKREIIELEAEVENINLNLEKSRSKFQKGILVATIGYTVTIAGGLMLGRENDDIGQVLLVAGGVTGITGTYMMVDAFKFLGRKRKE